MQGLKGKWVVAPVTDSLIYRSDRVKPELARWVDDVSKWDFTTIAPAHFDAGRAAADRTSTLTLTRNPNRNPNVDPNLYPYL